MTSRTWILRLRSRLAALAADRRGISAVEFAILLPFMVGLYIGSVELSEAVAINRKVTLTARTVADLVSQSTNINDAQMGDILNASSAVLTPYSVANATVVVSSIAIDAQGRATVSWSDALNGTARPVGQTVTLPAALAVPSSYLIFGEASYNFTPQLGYVITGTLNLPGSMYMRPRMSTCVVRHNPPCG